MSFAISPIADIPQRPALTISVATVVWFTAGALFVALRAGAALSLPVSGPELVHLSGAWQARIGQDDDRFIPTLFQALSAGLLHLSSSEMPARWLAVAASAAVPVALYRLRPALSEGGALVALALLAIDPAGILFGATASAMAFDTAIATWLLVAVVERWRRPAPLVVLGFLAASAGALALPLALAWFVLRLLNRQGTARGRAIPSSQTLAVAAGALAALVLASFGFGAGWQGLTIPAVRLVAASSEQRWAGPPAYDLAFLYLLPLVAGGLASLAAGALRGRRREADTSERLLVGWVTVALAWTVLTLGDHSPLPLAGATLPLALLSGPAIVRGLSAAGRADWSLARFTIPLALVFFTLAGAIVLDWAKLERTGSGSEVFRVFVFGLGGAALLGFLVASRATLATLVPLGVVAGLIWLAPGTAGVVTGGASEPLLTPLSPRQARDLRAFALEARAAGGPIVIHPSLYPEATWPFRDSGELVVSTAAIANASIIIWPADSPPPDGFRAVDGKWALTRELRTPTADLLDYLHWLVERNTLAARPGRVAVYMRSP